MVKRTLGRKQHEERMIAHARFEKEYRSRVDA